MQIISNLIESQFPSFYREHGPDFIAFVRAYYEWLEQEGNVLYESRDLINNFDIDSTKDEFLNHFKAKYMAGVPDEILGNQRFLQKHIVDLYRSKGSEEGIRLLFRLLFGEDIEMYVPKYDIFKTSDNTWIEPHYIEVTDSTHNNGLVNQYIWGSISGASAIVESVESKKVNGVAVTLLKISNIRGDFTPGESIFSENMPDAFPPEIIGSPIALRVISSTEGFNVGDILYDINESVPLKAVVTSVYSSFGVIAFEVVDGGSYYSVDAIPNITTGANTSGSGADFMIGEIADVQPFIYSNDLLEPYANVALNAATYGFPSNPTANSEDIIISCLDIQTIDVGRISTIIVTNPGSGYDDYVNVEVIDPHTSTRGIITPTGIGGMNADIAGNALSGDGFINNLMILDSSYTYNTHNEVITMQKEGGVEVSIVRVQLGGVGYSQGFFDNNNSFTSDTKYLYDGHYYQDFSYEIRTQLPFELYIDILKKLVHIGGNAVYGSFKTTTVNQFLFKSVADYITIITWLLNTGVWNDNGVWFDSIALGQYD